MTISRKDLIRAAELAGRLELDITADGPNGPVSYLIGQAHQEALEAIAAILQLDLYTRPDQEIVKEMRKHAADLDRYCDMIRWMQKAVAEGQDAEPQLDDADKEDILRAIGINEAPDA